MPIFSKSGSDKLAILQWMATHQKVYKYHKWVIKFLKRQDEFVGWEVGADMGRIKGSNWGEYD